MRPRALVSSTSCPKCKRMLMRTLTVEWDRGPMPNHPMWRENLFILRWAVWPIVVQWALLRYTGAPLILTLEIAMPYSCCRYPDRQHLRANCSSIFVSSLVHCIRHTDLLTRKTVHEGLRDVERGEEGAGYDCRRSSGPNYVGSGYFFGCKFFHVCSKMGDELILEGF